MEEVAITTAGIVSSSYGEIQGKGDLNMIAKEDAPRSCGSLDGY